ncbi:hypothetical protein VF21_10605 [Pseudogymnoascus sp. 05NY08]|nr:hypothetical protein VF21_10605 [Pseudogymnoascus sp. 05NY08]
MALYKQVFSELDDGQRYVWLNLDIDMVSIGSRVSFEAFKPVAHMIKRLKFERENQTEYFYHFESRAMLSFVNAEEIHVVCQDGFWDWHQAIEEHGWPSSAENIFFIDVDKGLMMNGIELEKMCDDEFEALQRQYDEEDAEEARILFEELTTLAD